MYVQSQSYQKGEEGSRFELHLLNLSFYLLVMRGNLKMNICVYVCMCVCIYVEVMSGDVKSLESHQLPSTLLPSHHSIRIALQSYPIQRVSENRLHQKDRADSVVIDSNRHFDLPFLYRSLINQMTRTI